MHELLGAISQESEIEFNGSILHDLLSELNGALLSLLHDLPEFIGKSISSLMKLLLGLIILPQVRVVIRELVEFEHKFIQNLLLSVESVQVLKELFSDGAGPNIGLLSIHPDIPEDSLHLTLVVFDKVLPQLDDDWFEVVIYVVTIWQFDKRQNACVILKRLSKG